MAKVQEYERESLFELKLKSFKLLGLIQNFLFYYCIVKIEDFCYISKILNFIIVIINQIY